MVNKRKAK